MTIRKNSIMVILALCIIFCMGVQGMAAYAYEGSNASDMTTTHDENIARTSRSANEYPNNQLGFHNIFSAQMKGEIKITGNTLQMPDERYYSLAAIDSYGQTGVGGRGSSQNNNLYMGPLDKDSDSQTRNSSAADVQIKAGAKIEKAFLVWGGSSASGDSANEKGKTSGKTPQEPPLAANEDDVQKGPVIKFKTPAMDAYTTIQPVEFNRISTYKKDYTAYADVTKLVQEGGAGTYWAGDLPLSTGYDTYGGWSLILVFKDDTCSQNDLNVFFGHRIIDSKTIAEIQINNLMTPPTGPVHTSIGMVIWEGDQAGSGDYIEIAKDADSTHRKIFDALNTETNMAGSAVTYKGAVVQDRQPAYTNTHGMDAKVIELTNFMENNQRSMHLRAGSAGDIYYPTIFTTEIELYKPQVVVKKSLKNITRPEAKTAMPGDVLEYTIHLKNTGYDTATQNVATDALPNNVDYIAESVKKLDGGKWLSKTDADNDDEINYNNTNKTLTFYYGDHATATTGGTLAYEQETTYSYRVKVNDAEGFDAVTNTVVAEYSGSGGDKETGGSSSDKSTVPFEPSSPDFTFTKKADKESLTLGDVITYTFTVKNTGNVTLNNLTLKDPMEGLSDVKLAKNELAPGESTSGTATYTVTQADVDKGQVENTATVTGMPPAKDGGTPPAPITKTSTVKVPSDPKPDFTFTKKADKESLNLGDVITYTFTVKNTGNVTLNNLTLKDPMEGLSDVKLAKNELAPGESTSGTATYTVTQADVDKGQVENTATVTGMPPAKDGGTPPAPITKTSTVKVPSDPKPDFTFTKKADKESLTLGDVITYTFTVKNTGNVTLNNLTLKDPMEGLSDVKLAKNELAPGESTSGTATYTVTQADVDKGQVENTATVTGMPPAKDGGTPPAPITKTSTVKIPVVKNEKPKKPNNPSKPDQPKPPSEPDQPSGGKTGDDTPDLNTTDHYSYIVGYPEDYRTGEQSSDEALWPVKPQGNITRAEVATIFYRLLKEEVRNEVTTSENGFNDVNNGDWYNETVSSLAAMDIIAGYEDGTFRPNAPITRAEFAAIAARFFEDNDMEYNEKLFRDISGDEWYADIVAAAVEHNLISGYPDGTMRPNAWITRAESCAVINRTIDRRPHDAHLASADDMRTWPDNQPGAWYYADMQEATNGHYYEWISIDGELFEQWTKVDLTYDWTKR